jgi:glycosyltransferase involved in cell wall biosynthesis
MKSFVFLLNSVIKGNESKSGGDVSFLNYLEDFTIENGIQEVKIYLITDEKFTIPDIEMKNVQVIGIRSGKNGLYKSYIIRTIVATYLCLKIRPNVIVSASDFFPDIIPAFVSKIVSRNLWFMFTWHQVRLRRLNGLKIMDRAINLVSILLQRMSLLLGNFSDRVFVSSNIGKIEISRFIKKRNVRVIVHKPIVKIKSIRKDEKYESDVIFIGRISQSKGLEPFLLNLDQLVTSGNKIKLVIVGGGDPNEIYKLNRVIRNLKSKVHSDNISIDYKGLLSDVEKFNYLGNSKILILPSLEEGYSFAIHEALCFNKQVVAWDLPSLKEIYSSEVNFVSRFKYSEFNNTILKLLKKYPIDETNSRSTIRLHPTKSRDLFE